MAAVPGAEALTPTQQQLLLEALDQEPAPCEPCVSQSIAACIVQPDTCDVVERLGARGLRLVSAGYPVEAVRDGVAYPDSHLPAAVSGELETGQVDLLLFMDPASSYLDMVLGQAERLSAPSVKLRVVPWAAEGAGRLVAARCTEAGVDGLACLQATQKVRRGEGVEPDALGLIAGDLESEAEAEAAKMAEVDQLAESLGVRSAPTWFVNGHRLRGAQSLGAVGRLVRLEKLDHGEVPPLEAQPGSEGAGSGRP